MARQPRAARKSCKEVEAEDTESEDKNSWQEELKIYIQQQLINFLIKKKPTKDEEEILKHVVEVYVDKLVSGTFEKHTKAQAQNKILQNTKAC